MNGSRFGRLARFGPVSGPSPCGSSRGRFLVYLAMGHIVDSARMQQFARFLAKYGFPLPALATPVSVYADLLSG